MEIQFEEKALGECLELVIDHRGKTPKKLGADWVNSGVPTISAKNVNGGRLVATAEIRHVSHDVYKRWMKEDVKRGDCFLVSEGATLGQCMLWDYDYPVVLGQRIFCLRANLSVLYPRYLYAYMTSASFQSEIIGRSTGTSVDGLRQTEVLKLKLRLPPMSQQKQIGDTLYNLDKKIELNQRMNATLETMARALFQSWFVDFDPVRAKLDGRQPAGLDPATATLFPNSFQNSEVGRIPVGWTVRSLGEVVHLGSGVPYEAKLKGDSGLPMITLGCVSFHDRFQDKGLTYYGGDYKETHVVKPDDLVVASHDVTQERKQLGSPAMVPRWLKGSTILAATNLYVVRNSSGFPNQFLYQLFRADGFRQQMVASAKGTAILFISKDSILRHRLAWPPEELAARFSAEAEALYALYSINAAQSRTLANLRDTLLPKLLSGKVRLSSSRFGT